VQIKIALHPRFWRTECVILERPRTEIRSNSLDLEQLAKVDPTEARNTTPVSEKVHGAIWT
jgi:hypothetical protein